MTDLRESVARAVYDATNTDRDWTMAPLLFSVADHILRAIADAGPTDGMVEKAARQLAQRHIEDSPLPLRDMTMGMWVDDHWQDFAVLARAAIAAALKEMGAG